MPNTEVTIPAIMGFILDIKNPHLLTKTKHQIIQGIRNMQSDDMAYTYPASKIPRWPGEAVQALSNYKYAPDFRLGKAFSQTATLLHEQDEDARRLIFLLTDHETTELDWNIKKAFIDPLPLLICDMDQPTERVKRLVPHTYHHQPNLIALIQEFLIPDKEKSWQPTPEE